jgi:thiamine kinase-like enzyme
MTNKIFTESSQYPSTAMVEWVHPSEIAEIYNVLNKPSVKADDMGSFISTATRVAVLQGGLTNRLYCVDTSQGLWVVRVSGENYEKHNINRDKEYQCIIAAYNAGITPDSRFITSELLTISRYIEGSITWKNENVQQNIPRCVEIIKKLHQIPLDQYSDHIFDVWGVCDQYLATSLEHGAPIPSDIEQIFAKANEMKRAVDDDATKFPTVACHNDLLAANWIEGSIDDKHQVRLAESSSASFDFSCVFVIQFQGCVSLSLSEISFNPSRTPFRCFILTCVPCDASSSALAH